MPPGEVAQPRRIGLARETFGRLLGVDTHGHRARSVYLGFDSSQMPNLRERRMELDALLGEAVRWDGGEDLPRVDGMALREDIEAVRPLFADGLSLAGDGLTGGKPVATAGEVA
jgi:hypothetical protein